MPGATDERTFHQRTMEEGCHYEKQVAEKLSGLVLDQLFARIVGCRR